MKNDFGVDRGNATEGEKLGSGLKRAPLHGLFLSGENMLETLRNVILSR